MQKRMQLFAYSFVPLLCLSLLFSGTVSAEETMEDEPVCTPMTEAHKLAGEAAAKNMVENLISKNERQAAKLKETFASKVERLKAKHGDFAKATRVAAQKKVARTAERTAVQETFKTTVTPLLEAFETAQTTQVTTFNTDSALALKTLLNDPLAANKEDLQGALNEALVSFKEKCDEDFADAKQELLLELKSDRESYLREASSAIKLARQRLTEMHKALLKNTDTSAFKELKNKVKEAEKVRDAALRGLRTPTQGTPTQGTPTQGTPTQGHETPTQG